jgi:hypothetical protein
MFTAIVGIDLVVVQPALRVGKRAAEPGGPPVSGGVLHEPKSGVLTKDGTRKVLIS